MKRWQLDGAQVVWVHADGTTRTDRFAGPVASAQIWPDGRGIVLLGTDAAITGGASYQCVSRIVFGTALKRRKKGR